jgi:hypothetical protein
MVLVERREQGSRSGWVLGASPLVTTRPLLVRLKGVLLLGLGGVPYSRGGEGRRDQFTSAHVTYSVHYNDDIENVQFKLFSNSFSVLAGFITGKIEFLVYKAVFGRNAIAGNVHGLELVSKIPLLARLGYIIRNLKLGLTKLAVCII